MPIADVDRRAAMALADELLASAARLEARADARRRRRLARMASSIDFTLAVTDGVARISDPARAVRRLASLDIPPSLGTVDRILVRSGVVLGRAWPAPVAALVRRRIRAEAAAVVLPAEDRRLTRYLARRRSEGIALNLNLLGEAILGDGEAARRAAQLLRYVRRPDVDYVSVKASALCARLSSLAFDTSVARVVDALSPLLDEKAFINVDMEEYRDLDVTLAAFMEALSAPAHRGIDAGIVLQAYLPDAHGALERIAAWAAARHADGGGRVKVRVVKGANLAMERVDAELHGWTAAPYPTKLDTDASYLLLLRRALDPAWGDGLRVGLASHNLFDVAWGLLAADTLGTSHRLEVEMLEGMAPGAAAAVRRRGVPVRLYAPVVHAAEFDAAVAYLARRLDENNAPENYLHHLVTGDLEAERRNFSAAVDRAADPAFSIEPRRNQHRAAEVVGPIGCAAFANQADTDWATAANRTWISGALTARRAERWARWPAPPPVETVVATAARAGRASVEERARWLTAAAGRLAARRGALIATMVDDGAKVVSEADVEVSEAVDFAAYYAAQARTLSPSTARPTPLGTVVVAPPWNFPLAIPMGGTLAALAAGNAVVVKPAPETVETAWAGVQCLWEAGVPTDVLQFAPYPDGSDSRRLVTHPSVDAVILTGAYETAQTFLDWRPDLCLLAETSGKNAIVVTATADLDLAVSDVVRSAFGHAGQKCSAASLAIVERSVLADGRFAAKLADATRTLVVGEAADPATEVVPLIRAPGPALARALTTLEPGEEWLVEPVQRGPLLWSPGIRTGVDPGSWFHQTECFGPVLGVMAANDLDHAVDLQNATPYGLTGGIQSLDPDEVRRWLDRVEVGNAYVNRPITGAVVGRQPFGGWKRSSVGPTAKAGGPGYVATLCRWADGRNNRVAAARASYPAAWADRGAVRELGGLKAEVNLLRLLPLPSVIVRVEDGADPEDVALCELAAATVGVPIRISTGRDDPLAGPGAVARLRLLGPADEALLRAAHRAAVVVDGRPPVSDGKVELPRWTREQSISITAHRYGRPLPRDALGLPAGVRL